MTGMTWGRGLALGGCMLMVATPLSAQIVTGAIFSGPSDSRQSSSLGQSFTITATGAITEVQIYARSFGAMTSSFELWSGEGKTGSLLGNLAWVRNDGLDVTGWFTVLTNPGVYATTGDRFTLFQQVDTGGRGLAWHTRNLMGQGNTFGVDAYRGGSLRDPLSGDSFDQDQSVGTAGQTSYRSDALFRVSIDTAVTAVPEPASWALMLVGFAAIGGALRIRRRRVAFA